MSKQSGSGDKDWHDAQKEPVTDKEREETNRAIGSKEMQDAIDDAARKAREINERKKG